MIVLKTTIANRKRADKASNEVPAPKCLRSNAAEQLLETIRIQNQQIEQDINTWIRLEAKLRDANTDFLIIIKSAMYGGTLGWESGEAGY